MCQLMERDFQKGIICSLTGAKRLVENCSDYTEDADRKEKEELIQRKQRQAKSDRRRNGLVVAALVPLTIILVVVTLFVVDGEFFIGSILGYLGYIGLFLMLSDRYSNSRLIIPLLICVQVFFYFFLIPFENWARFEFYVLIIILWPFLITKYLLMREIVSLVTK